MPACTDLEVVFPSYPHSSYYLSLQFKKLFSDFRPNDCIFYEWSSFRVWAIVVIASALLSTLGSSFFPSPRPSHRTHSVKDSDLHSAASILMSLSPQIHVFLPSFSGLISTVCTFKCVFLNIIKLSVEVT